MEKKQDDPDALVFVPLLNKHVCIQDKFDIICEDDSLSTINVFKDQLVSTVDKLYETIDFLKRELEEKNILVKTLLSHKNNNRVDESFKATQNRSTQVVETTSRSSISKISNDYSIASSNQSVCEYSLTDEVSNGSSTAMDLNENVFMNSTHNFKSIEEQITSYKINSHNKYLLTKNGVINNTNVDSIDCQYHFNNSNLATINKTDTLLTRHDLYTSGIKPSEVHLWPKDTVLITGDSILNGIEENRMRNNKKHLIKVRAFSGASVFDMYSYITPLLRKKPTYIILHIGSNNSTNKTANEIYDEILTLKEHIIEALPTCTVYLSAPVLRLDNGKAGMTLKSLANKMKDLDNVIFNDNIDVTCLGGKGLHLNPKGSGRLAINYLSQIRRL